MFIANIQYEIDTSITHNINVYVDTLYEAEIYIKRLICFGFDTEDVELYYVDDFLYHVYVDFQYAGTIQITVLD